MLAPLRRGQIKRGGDLRGGIVRKVAPVARVARQRRQKLQMHVDHRLREDQAQRIEQRLGALVVGFNTQAAVRPRVTHRDWK